MEKVTRALGGKGPAAGARRRAGELALALLAALALFVALELALALAGVGGSPERAVGPLGYEANAAYFVPDPEVPGAWRTQFLQKYPPELRIRPRGARPRILISGASTAHSFWAGHLDRALERTLGRPFELVNLGRGGYGSERVSIVLEQALERFDPDFVFVYTGDNEFVEVPPADRERSWKERLASLRTLRWLARLVGAEPAAPAPEPWIPFGGPQVLDVHYPETLERLEGLRANLRRICRLAAEHDVPLALSTVLYNRMCAPFVSSLPEGTSAEDRAAIARLREEALGLFPGFMAPILTRNPWERVQVGDWTANATPGEDARARWELPGRRPSDAQLARQRPYSTQPWEWSERIWTLFEALERYHARALEPGERADLERAEGLLREVLALCPDHPGAHFELALASDLLGRDRAEVRRQFELAGDYDRLPLKGNELVNGIIREVAAEFPGVLLFDADRLMAERVPDGMLGWEWMLDHAHVAKGARAVLMQDLALAVAERWPELGAD